MNPLLPILPPRAQRIIRLDVAGRSIPDEVALRWRLPDLARWALRLDQQWADRRSGQACGNGAVISCCAGCGACCRQVVPVSPPEVWMIAEMVEALPHARRLEVLRRFDSVRNALAGGGLVDMPLIDQAAEYFKLGVPCPFLEMESCSIHPDRPAACREHLVTSPASYCSELNGGAAVLSIPISMTSLLASVAARLLGTAPTLVPLARALDWAKSHAADGRREWNGLRLIELLCQEEGRKGNSLG